MFLNGNPSIINKNGSTFCWTYCLGKSINFLNFLHSSLEYTNPLELIHSYMWGPLPSIFSSGYHYYIHFVNAFSYFTWIDILRNKFEALQTFINFKNQVELLLGHKIWFIQIDWDGKYRTFTNFLLSHVIINHNNSYSYTHKT